MAHSLCSVFWLFFVCSLPLLSLLICPFGLFIRRCACGGRPGDVDDDVNDGNYADGGASVILETGAVGRRERALASRAVAGKYWSGKAAPNSGPDAGTCVLGALAIIIMIITVIVSRKCTVQRPWWPELLP